MPTLSQRGGVTFDSLVTEHGSSHRQPGVTTLVTRTRLPRHHRVLRNQDGAEFAHINFLIAVE